MKKSNWTVLLASLVLVSGCATTQPNALDTAGRGVSALSVPGDSDGDSIPDADDACMDTASRVMVDSAGCQIAMGPIEGLKFGLNEVSLSDSERLILDSYIDAMKRYQNVVVSVEGHTDNRGPAAGNLELSKERVLSVVRYMVGNGISPTRIKPFGYGESRPRAANATAEGREQNRRIEIKLLEGLL